MIAAIKARLGQELETLSDELARRAALSFDLDAGSPVGIRDDEGSVHFLQRRLAELGHLVAGLSALDSTAVTIDRAGYGSVVEVRDPESGDRSVFTLMTGDLVNIQEGHVSTASPIGYALLGRVPGDRVAVATPRGERRFEVLSVTTLPQRLGIASALAESPSQAGATRVA